VSGERVREILEDTGWTYVRAAEVAGCGVQSIYRAVAATKEDPPAVATKGLWPVYMKSLERGYKRWKRKQGSQSEPREEA